MLDLPDVEIDEAHCEHVVGEESELILAVCFSMSEIPEKLQNYFKKISFYRVALFADGYFDGDFLATVQTDGLNAALHAKDRNKRTRYLRRLSVHQYEPINLRRLSIKRGIESLSFLGVNRVNAA